MNALLILFAVIIFTCIFLNSISSKAGVPVLLLFIVFGILFGLAEPDSNSKEALWLVEKVSTVALIFIMFYGGFGTKWSSARPVVVESGILATLGVILTAALVGLFCHFVLGWGLVEGLLMGSVVSSTDAASVFSILRSRKLGLKNNTAPLLEIESGSNDPCSYMMTAIMLSMLGGSASGGQVVWMIFSQLVFGALCGALVAQGAIFVLRRFNISAAGFDSLFILAVAIVAYALPSLIGGNGYLSTYIVGIILGNTSFRGRKPLVHFFDGVTSLMQILIFFLLGFIANPESLHKAVVPALIIYAFLTIVARPLAVASILTPFRKYGIKQQTLISFVGLRGAASIVFAIMAISGGVPIEHDIFNIVFCIVLISISLQGSLIPFAAKKLDMIDTSEDVLKTFNDFADESDIAFSKIEIGPQNPWKDKMVKDLGIPHNVLLTMIVRGQENIIPTGSTVILEGDVIISSTKAFDSENLVNLREHTVRKGSRWAGRPIKEYPNRHRDLVVLVRRGDDSLIPNGETVLEEGDTLVIMNR